MKKKSKSILAIVLAILLLLVVAVTLTTNILFSRSDTPKFFGHYIYLMESDVMEAGSDTAVATGVTALDDGAAGLQENTASEPSQPVDSESAAASIHQYTAVIASAYSESDPIAKNNAVLCILAPDDTSTDIDSERIAVRRIYNIEQDETGVLKYYPTTMQTSAVGTEPPITVDNILGKCAYESGELYSYIKFATGVPGILTLLVLPSVILVIMLIIAIARANSRHDDEFAFEESYDEVYSEDSYDSDSEYDEDLGGRSPLFRPSDTASSRSFEQKRSSIAQNFERKAVNPNSPYQKARTMQFKAQHDIPIYTNPEDQIPLSESASDDGYRGTHAGSVSNTATFGTRGNTDTFRAGAVSHAADTPISEEPVSTYRGSHEASSPEEARNLGSSRLSSGSTSRSARPTANPSPKPSVPKRDKITSASVDELLAMIEDEKKKLNK